MKRTETNTKSEPGLPRFYSRQFSFWIFFSSDVQFAYTDNIDLLSGLAIWSLDTPVLFIFNTTNYKYGLVDFNDTLSDDVIDQIIQDIRNSRIQVFSSP